MLTRQIALVSESKGTTQTDVANVGAALQKQVTRDFAPVWEIQASVDVFPTLDDVPLGYWPIVVLDDIQTPGAAGIHQDKDGQPIALVQFDDGWSLTASHECLEMLGDPFGNRLMAGQSPMPDQGRVEFLVEVCDPSEAPEFGYTANNVLVSDFYTPNYFDPAPNPAVRYSFTASIKEPRQVLKGGYLSWHDMATDHWFQEVWFGAAPEFRDIGALGRLNENLRASIYLFHPEERLRLSKQAREYFRSRNLRASLTSAAARSKNKASAWRTRIGEILKTGGPPA